MNKIKCCFVIAAMMLFSCQTGLAKGRPTAQDWFQKGMEFEKQNVFEEAIEMYTMAVMIDKNYSEAYFRRAKAYMAAHKTFAVEARSDFDKAIDLNPTDAEAYYERGLLHAFILNNENARSDMRTAANLGHQGARAWLAPAPREQSGKMESTSMTAAVTSRDDASQPRTAGEGEKSDKQAARHLDLGKYMSSNGKPMIHFDFNRSAIKEQYHAVIDEIALVLKEKIPESHVTLAGHTDSTGTEKYNDHLSLQRAKAVESYLTVNHGISPDRITVRGYGESAPIASNETKDGQARNRRAELLVE
jgi:outer membrane protein OmpA-like peptidoglycan-associated protein